jgi:1-phosphofructokinase
MRPKISVFSPCPILTVTIEGEGDDVSLHLHAGGQGVWVARMAEVLGAEVTLCTSIGGETGQVIRTLLDASSINVVASHAAGASPAYVHQRGDGDREQLAATAAAPLSRHEADELYNIAIAEGLSSEVMVLTGQNDFHSVPPEMYRRLCDDLDSAGTRLVADLSGEELDAVRNVEILKVAHDALMEHGDSATGDADEIALILQEFGEGKARNAVVSRAERPAIALFDGELLEVTPPSFEPIDHRGAGDSMTAALAVGLASGLGTEATLQLAAAAGAANAIRHGLGSGHRESIEKIAKAVTVKRLPMPEGRSKPGAATSDVRGPG